MLYLCPPAMSFSFQWPRFSPQFHADAIEMLNAALNKGPKPPVIADKIEVVELEMGTQVRVSASVLLPVVLIPCRVTAPRAGDSRYRRPYHGAVSRDFSYDLRG